MYDSDLAKQVTTSQCPNTICVSFPKERQQWQIFGVIMKNKSQLVLVLLSIVGTLKTWRAQKAKYYRMNNWYYIISSEEKKKRRLNESSVFLLLQTSNSAENTWKVVLFYFFQRNARKNVFSWYQSFFKLLQICQLVSVFLYYYDLQCWI